MFRGSSFHSLDAKGRLIIPARFRDVFKEGTAEGLMVSKMDGALVCYPFEEWYEIERRILNMAVTSENMRRFRRVFIGGAFECMLDKQGRILIPATLRQYAKVDREVVLVGVLDHFEIWAKEEYLNQDDQLQSDMKKEDMRNEIAALGL